MCVCFFSSWLQKVEKWEQSPLLKDGPQEILTRPQTVNKEGMIYWKSLQDGAYYSIVSTTEGQNRRGFGNASLVMNFSGKIDYWEQSTNGTWSLSAADPSDNCYVYNFCGKFGSCKLPCKCLPGFMPHVAQNQSSIKMKSICLFIQLLLHNCH